MMKRYKLFISTLFYTISYYNSANFSNSFIRRYNGDPN